MLRDVNSDLRLPGGGGMAGVTWRQQGDLPRRRSQQDKTEQRSLTEPLSTTFLSSLLKGQGKAGVGEARDNINQSPAFYKESLSSPFYSAGPLGVQVRCSVKVKCLKSNSRVWDPDNHSGSLLSSGLCLRCSENL